MHGEEKAKEIRTDERRQQRLDKNKREAKEYNETRWQKQVDLHGEGKAKEMMTDERRQQRLDKKKRGAEVKKRGAGIGAEGGGGLI